MQSLRNAPYSAERLQFVMTSSMLCGGLYKIHPTVWDFSIYLVCYESEQGCQGFMLKDPYYVGGIGISPKIFNPGN